MVFFKHFVAQFQSLLFFFTCSLQLLNLILNNPMCHRNQEHLFFLLNQINNRLLRNTIFLHLLPFSCYLQSHLDYFLILRVIGSFWHEFFLLLRFKILSSKFSFYLEMFKLCPVRCGFFIPNTLTLIGHFGLLFTESFVLPEKENLFIRW